MILANIKSAACFGIDAYPVQIEVDVAQGLPQLIVVGLPDASVKEAKERVRSAIKNSGYRFPTEKITINLAPADIKKEGSAYDLPIALGILAATEIIPGESLRNSIFLGELALDGKLRPFKGAITITESLKHLGKNFIFPEANAIEASLSENVTTYGACCLKDVVDFCLGKKVLPQIQKSHWRNLLQSDAIHTNDFSDIKGQYQARRATEIAVAGGHNLLLIGSPGSGKTMIANRIPSIMPGLEFQEAIDITKVHSIAGILPGKERIAKQRPFRQPHHTISAVAMVGGGSWPKPGEVSLAHHGVLFLDEFPEFKRDVLETLRTPIEEGVITISRTKIQMNYPCRFMLVAAMNPCPCGYLYDAKKQCRCTMSQIQKYQARISGPILDRIDLHVEVPTMDYKNLMNDYKAEESATIRERILTCREIQKERFKNQPYSINAQMSLKEIKRTAILNSESKRLLESAMKDLNLSARAYFKILKVARTIADLAGKETILGKHIAEAIQYRTLDRQW